MNSSRVKKLGRIEVQINRTSVLTDYIVKKSGPIFFLTDTDSDAYEEYGEGVQLAFHEWEILEQVGNTTHKTKLKSSIRSGEIFLHFLCCILCYESDLSNSEIIRNRQLLTVLNDLLDAAISTSESGVTRLALRVGPPPGICLGEPQKFVTLGKPIMK